MYKITIKWGMNHEQKNFVSNCCKFLQTNEFFFNLSGYAGTGKTFALKGLLSEIFSTRNVIFVAPTNKAVSILRKTIQAKCNFLTFARFFGYQKKFDDNGDTNFVASKNGFYDAVYQYDCNYSCFSTHKHYRIHQPTLLIIDECSMLSKSQCNVLKEYVEKTHQYHLEQIRLRVKFEKKKTIPCDEIKCIDKIFYMIEEKREELKQFKFQVLLIGDTSQIPPIDKKVTKPYISPSFKFSCGLSNIFLKTIMRYNDNENIGKVAEICRNFTESTKKTNTEILSEIRKICDGQFCKSLCGYDNEETFIKKFVDTYQDSNIIICYKNKPRYKYNYTIRDLLIETSTPTKFQQNEIMMFDEYFSYYNPIDKNLMRFYSCDQVQICRIEIKNNHRIDYLETNFNCIKYYFSNYLYLYQIENYTKYDKFQKLMRFKQKQIQTCLKIWKKFKEEWKKYHQDEKVPFHVKKLWKQLQPQMESCTTILVMHQEKKRRRDDEWREMCDNIKILKSTDFWKEYSRIKQMYDAKVNYGYAITAHKSQGSTFDNVFIDINEMLMENKWASNFLISRLLYTAVSRTKKTLHILFK